MGGWGMDAGSLEVGETPQRRFYAVFDFLESENFPGEKSWELGNSRRPYIACSSETLADPRDGNPGPGGGPGP